MKDADSKAAMKDADSKAAICPPFQSTSRVLALARRRFHKAAVVAGLGLAAVDEALGEDSSATDERPQAGDRFVSAEGDHEGSEIKPGRRKHEELKMMMRVVALLLASVAPAWADNWIAFSMGEGPDLNLDRLSIQRDTDGAIVPWGKGWMTARTKTSEGASHSPGYFVTDCRDLYYIFRVNPQSGAVEDEGAKPLHIGDGTVAQRIQNLVCGGAK